MNHEEFREANSPETPKDRLIELALSDNEVIRGAVAMNKNPPMECKEILFNNFSQYIIDVLSMIGVPMNLQIKKAKKIIGNTLVLRDVLIEDAEFILSLRNDDKKSKFISKTSGYVEQQKNWINRYSMSISQAYFIIESLDGNKIGTVRLYDSIGDSFCWGSWILSKEAHVSAAIESALIVYSYAMKLGFKNSHFDVRKGNSSVCKFHERFGATFVEEDEINLFYKISHQDILKSIHKYKKYLPSGIEIIHE
jgi:RimJ/RimL family protein N-acetyltransferase